MAAHPRDAEAGRDGARLIARADLGAPPDRRAPARRGWAVLTLALIPFVAIGFSVGLWDRIDPMVFGLPFNFFWLIAWMVLTPICLWGTYRLGGYGAGRRTGAREP